MTEAPVAIPSYLSLLIVIEPQVFCVPAEMMYAWPAVMGKSSKEKISCCRPKAFKVSAEIEVECELYGCLGMFPPQGRTLRQTS